MLINVIPYRGMLNSIKKKESLKRLNRISGQINGIRKMVDEGRYCIDVLTQIAAARAALNSAGKFILEDHLKTCVSSAIISGKASSKIDEILKLLDKY